MRNIKKESALTNGITNGHNQHVNENDQEDTTDSFDSDRIISKRGRKSRNSVEYHIEQQHTSRSNDLIETLNESLEVEKQPQITIPNEILKDMMIETDKPLPNPSRRRRAFTVVQSIPSPTPPVKRQRFEIKMSHLNKLIFTKISRSFKLEVKLCIK